MPGTLRDAESEAAQALNADPDAGATHAALGVIHAVQGRWLEAEDDFRRSLVLDEGDPWAHLCYGMHLLGTAGHLKRYMSAAREAQRLAPAWPVNAVNLMVLDLVLGNDAGAQSYADAAAELGMPKVAVPLVDGLSQLAVRAGRYEDAAALIIASVPATLQQSRGLDTVSRIFTAFVDPRERPRAIAELDALRNGVDPLPRNQFVRRRFLVWYSMLGALDQAYAVINESLDEFADSGTIGASWCLLWMPELKRFRDDPRFAALCERMKLPDYWDRYAHRTATTGATAA